MNSLLSELVLFDKNKTAKISLRYALRTDFVKFCILLVIVSAIFGNISNASAQGLDVNTCPTIEKRSNGNGQYALSPGIFPGYGINNSVAINVQGTTYQTVIYDPASKTGNVNFKWSSSTLVTKLPVITRVWLTAKGATNGTLSAIKFGPPPPPTKSGQAYYASYSFYNQNMPAAGKVTLEFADPQTNIPAFYCTFDLQQNTTTTPPIIDCAPIISAQPVNTNTVCDASSATFNVTASGVGTYQWQVSSNRGISYQNISNGGNYSGATSSSLVISNPSLYDSSLYRVVLSNSTCSSTTSNAAMLTSKSKPTASFQSFSNVCGIEDKNIGVSLTGTGPWSITVKTTPAVGSPSTQTISNIQSSPYYLKLSPSQQTTYQITAVSDKFCSNTYATANSSNSIVIYPKPSITPINDTICFGATNFQFRFTTTNSPNKYSISKGSRAMSSFTDIVDANITGGNISITIPAGVAVGDYDFVVSVKNSVTGCISDAKNIVVKVASVPTMELSANRVSFCAGDSITLTATSFGFTNFQWSSTNGHSIGNVSTIKVKVNSATTFTVTGTDVNGCSSTSSLTLTPSAGSSVSISPTSSTICFGSSVALVANGGSNYTWSPSTGLSTTIGSTVIASPTSTTTYTVTSTNDAGCVSTAQIVVTVSNQNLSISPSSSSICEGGSVSLTASGGSNYEWYPSTGLSATTGANVTANPTSTTTYYVRSVDGAGCSKVASVTVTVSKTPVNVNTSTPSNLIFCTSGVTSFPLSIDITESGTTRFWAYSTTAGGHYTYFSNDTTVGGILFDMSTPSTDNSTLTISGYGNGNYTGARYFRLKIVGTSCTYFYDIKITDTKSDPLETPTADKTTVCNNEGTVLRAGKVSSGSSIQWQSSSSSVSNTFTDITNATSDTLATGSLTSNTYYRIKASSTRGASCNATSSPILISVTSTLGSNTISVTSSCTNPRNTSQSIAGSTVSGANYQWQSSTTSSTTGFSDILGEQSKDYTLPSNVVQTTTWFRRLVSSNACNASASNTLVLYAPIANNQLSAATSEYCDSAAATLITGTTPTGGDGNYVYKWQRSSTSAETGFTDISSSNVQSYTTTKTNTTYWYRRLITAGSCTDTSEAVKIRVSTSSAVSVTSNQTICSGYSVTLQASGATNYTWSPTTGLSSSVGSSVVANPTVTTTYTVTGTNSNGCSKTAQVTVTVNNSPSVPTLSTSNKTVCSSDGSFDISSLITSGVGVEWYTVPEVNSSFKITNTVRSSSGTFYAFAKNGSCYSATYATLNLTIVNTSKPDISRNSIRLCSPETFDLTTLQPPSREGVTFRWYTNTSPTAPSEVSTPTSVTTGTYYLFAYSSQGNCFSPASNAVNVVVNATTTATVAITSLNVCSANSINLNDYNTTSGNNTYNWYTVSSNPTINDLVLNPEYVTQSGTYYLYATNSSGCIGNASQGLTVTFNTSPSANIGTINAYCGQSLRTVSVTTNAASPLYRWQVSTNNGQSWTNLSNNSIYSGVTTSTLSINNTTGLDGYFYRANVQNAANSCNTLSDYVVLVEDVIPSINSQPANQTIRIGDTTIISIGVTGSPTVDYQWKVSTNNGVSYSNLSDNSNYVGSNSNPLIIIGAPVSFNGYLYKCEILNYCDTLMSNAARLLVTNTPNQAPVANDDSKTINEDQSTTGSVRTNDSDPENDNLTYSVINNTDKGTLNLNTDGTYTYTPNPNANGNDTLIYKVCDSGVPSKCDTAKLIITINPVNDPPVALSDTIRKTTNEDEPIVICIPANDAERNRIDITSVSGLNKGTSSSTAGLDSCFTFTPSPNVSGLDTVRVIISDGNGGFDTVQIIINILPVNDPPIANNDSKTINEDEPTTGTVATNDTDIENDVLTFSVVQPTKKGSLTLNPNGSYSYTPQANFNGNDTLIYKVCDNGIPNKCDTAILVISITPVNDPPVAISDTIRRTTNEDEPIVICIPATDAEKNRIDITSVSGLNKGTSSSTSGLDSCFTFTPTPNVNGLDTLQIIIGDGNGGFDTIQVIVNILPVNDPPVAVNDIRNINEDQQVSGSVATNDSDIDNNVLTFSVLDYTDKGSITLNPNGTYTYIPNANVTGSDTLIYLVCDNGSPSKCDTGLLIINIAQVNDPPIAVNDTKTINEDQATSGTVANNDSDPENNALTFSILENTKKGTLVLNSSGTYTYSPQLNFNGSDTLVYKVCDNGVPSKCDTAILVITINPVNDPPIATDDTKSVNEDGTANGTIASNDTDPENDLLFFSILDNTDKGILVLNPNGTYTYTTNPNASGNDTLIYLVCDNGSPSRCDTGILVITIIPVNDPPVALNDAKTINEDQLATGTVATNDSDIENGLLTFSVVDNTNNGTITFNSNGTYIYTPNLNFNGSDTLVYKVCDNGTPVQCDTALLIITVLPVNDPPKSNSDTIRKVTLEGQAVIICIEASDVDGDPISILSIKDLSLGTVSNVNANDSCFTYYPSPNQHGTDSIKVIISDGKGGFDTVTVIITIIPVNDPPSALNDYKTLKEDESASGTVATNDTDADGDPLSYTQISQAEHGNISFNTNGSYTYTPSKDFFGVDSIQYSVCDNANPSLCDTALLYLTITPVNDKPVAVDDSVVTEMNKSVRINVAQNDFDIDNDPLSFTYSSARYGSFTLESNGVIIYNPKFNFIGIDSIRYILCDGKLCDTATIYVDVKGKLNPSIGVSLAVSAPIILTPETFNITYTIVVKNYGDVDLRNVRVLENLKEVFPEPTEFDILEMKSETGLTLNPNFDGLSDIELLDPSSSFLNIGEQKVITIKLFIKPNATVVNYANQVKAFGTGDLILSDSTVSDLSTVGLDPDPDGDGIPSENEFTETQLKMFVPNGFSPDGDGVNDAFVIKGIENYPNNTLTIFNRWGNKVYEESPYKNNWTGNSKNASGIILSDGVLPIGTYFYIIDFGVEGVKPQTGFVVIKK